MKTRKLNKVVFWLLSLTWGLPMTLLGAIGTLALKLCGKTVTKNAYGYKTIVGRGWGGLSFGPFSYIAEDDADTLACHEFGHSIQNCYFGPLMPFLVNIPSACRYWYRRIVHKKHPERRLPPYGAIWFEGQANELGKATVDKYFG